MPRQSSSARTSRNPNLGEIRFAARARNPRTILSGSFHSSIFFQRPHDELTISRFLRSGASGRGDLRLNYPLGLGVDIELAALGAWLDSRIH